MVGGRGGEGRRRRSSEGGWEDGREVWRWRVGVERRLVLLAVLSCGSDACRCCDILAYGGVVPGVQD